MARRRPRRKKKQVGFPGVLLFLLVAVVATGAVYLVSRGLLGGEDEEAAPTRVEPAPETAPAPPPARQPPLAPAPEEVPGDASAKLPAAGGARVAVVIDDLGRSVADVAVLGRLGVPLSYAVLPFESRTPEVVRELARLDREILLHLPMEAANGANPGPGALTLAMGDRELRRATRAALAAVPGAIGVNNHMGSVFSADRRAMHKVLAEVGRHDLYFLDSRTTADTVGFEEASRLGIPAAERQVFLDRDPDPRAIHGEVRRLLELARERGSAIAIGHPHPETLTVLAQEIPGALAAGYEFVPVSYLLQRSGDLPE